MGNNQEEAQYIRFIVKYAKMEEDGQDVKDIPFRVKYGIDMGKLKRSYAALSGISVKCLVFLFDGRRVTDDDTPRSMEMEEDDVIEVYQLYESRMNNATSAELLSLPRQAMNHICSFFDKKSLVRIRQVSKKAKGTVDGFFVHVVMRTQNTVMDTFSVEGTDNGLQSAVFRFLFFTCPRSYFFWKICFDEFALTRPYIDVQTSTQGHMSTLTASTIRPRLIEEFIEFIKPRIHLTQIRYLTFTSCHSAVINKCLNILEGKTVPNQIIFGLDSTTAAVPDCLDFIRTSQAEIVNFDNFPLTEVSILLLFQLTELVERMTISVNRDRRGLSTIPTLPFSALTHFLSRCNNFTFVDPYTLFTLEAAEKLIQFFHHKDERKIEFSGLTDADPMVV
ncbi:hypothetical protein PENTCL1PPCAC_28458, partial [Pristionchus entomophagus]